MSITNYGKDFPFVTALLVIRNEEEYVESALMSYVDQDYPKSNYEIIVIDGNSTDSTLDIVKRIKAKEETDEFEISILDNPHNNLASGWNIGIKKAKGEYVVRIDAHAKAYRDFIRKSVETIENIKAICVGGRLITKTLQSKNDTIAKVYSSPFGVGNSSFRVSKKAGYVDTVVYGMYKKSVFEEIGYFNEKYARNQDLQMHSRIRKAGYKFYFNPDIKCEYYARNTVKKMVKQALGNGKWNMVLLKEDLSGLSARHLTPLIFVIFILLSTIFGFLNKLIWILEIAVLIIHFSFGIIYGVKGHAKGIEIIEIAILFFIFHISYGIGYLFGFKEQI